MRNIKQKIFDKMMEYGWNLGYNTYEDFDKVFELHKKQIDDRWELLEENYGVLTDSERERELEGLRFITDFLRAINDCEDENEE